MGKDINDVIQALEDDFFNVFQCFKENQMKAHKDK